MSNFFGKWGIPVLPGSRPGGGKGTPKAYKNFYLRVGQIVRVDPLNWIVDVEWADSHGGRTEVPISVAMGTLRTFAGFMPEEHALVVCGFVRHTDSDSRPIVVAYLPNGFKSGYNFAPVMHGPEELGFKQIRCRMQKLYPGEGLFQSTQGSWERFDANLQGYSSDSTGHLMDSFSHTYAVRGLNYALRTMMGRTREGLVVRNVVLGVDGKPLPGVAQEQPMALRDGRDWYVVTDSHESMDENEDAKAWVEHFQKVRERVSGWADITAEFDNDDQFYTREPDFLLERSLGTLVGEDPRDAATYGLVLRRVLFTNPFQSFDDPMYVPCVDLSERLQLAELKHFKTYKVSDYGGGKKRSSFTGKMSPAAPVQDAPSSDTSFDVNKEGKLQAHIGASSSKDPLGAGRSVELGTDGSVKITLGANTDKEQSLIVDTAGGWRIRILGPDTSGEAMNLQIKGKVYILVDGDLTTEVTGNETHMVHGSRSVIVGKKEYRSSGKGMSDVAPIISHN